MPKGKKFSAAEKHFEKKRLILQAEVDYYRTKYVELNNEQAQLKDEVNTLELENVKLKELNERLLEHTGLSEEDITQVCEAEKKKGEALHTFASLMKMANMFRY